MVLIVFFSLMQLAQGLVYEGQLYDSNGAVINEPGVGVKFELFDDSTCVLYERDFSLDLSASNGHFSVDLSGGNTVGGPHGANDLNTTLSNSAGNSVTCKDGATRNFDGSFVKRRLRLTVTAINSVDIANIVLPFSELKLLPYANQAQTANSLQGVLIDSTAPSDGQVLRYSSATLRYQPANVVGTGVQAVEDVDPCDAGKGGALRYNSTTGGMDYCDGVASLWKPLTVASGVPAGAVMGFNLATCPSGWSPVGGAQGRVLIGVGSLSTETYSLLDTGGSAFHTLSVSELPAHSHSVDPPNTSTNTTGSHTHTYTYKASEPATEGGTGTSRWDGSSSRTSSSSGAHSHTVDIAQFDSGSAGTSSPHENRPPYLAVLFCQKD